MDAHGQAPLPSLTQLRLQRANSAASRLEALERLTGERPTTLARSNTVAAVGGEPGDATIDGQGSRSGGLERRSVIGRRMMDRLGTRIAARQQQQQQKDATRRAVTPSPPEIHLHPPPSSFPIVDPREEQNVRSTSAAGSDSGSAVFEYEAHLSRNPSVRATAIAAIQAGEERAVASTDLGSHGGQSQSRVEEVLVSPSRRGFGESSETPLHREGMVAPVRYALQDLGSTSSNIQQYQQTPPRKADAAEVPVVPHYTSPSASSMLSSTRSYASGTTIPFLISSDNTVIDYWNHPALPPHLPPALEPMISSAAGTREQDTMSRFPQAVASGVGSGYFQHGYFVRAPNMEEVSKEDGENEDTRSDVTERIGASVGGTGVVDSDVYRTSRSASLMS